VPKNKQVNKQTNKKNQSSESDSKSKFFLIGIVASSQTTFLDPRAIWIEIFSHLFLLLLYFCPILIPLK